MKLGIEDNNRIAERAARYLGALTEGNEERGAFFAWLAESPRHVEEFRFVLRAAQEVSGFTEEQERKIEGIEDEIEGNVVELEESSNGRPHLTLTLSPPAGRRGEKRWMAIAAAVVVSLNEAWPETDRRSPDLIGAIRPFLSILLIFQQHSRIKHPSRARDGLRRAVRD
jgi:ferric-dicitrate binding protein FerR (iron transport regulator)